MPEHLLWSKAKRAREVLAGISPVRCTVLVTPFLAVRSPWRGEHLLSAPKHACQGFG
jgi:hypothetical protein